MKRKRATTSISALALVAVLLAGNASAEEAWLNLEFEESLLASPDQRFHQIHGDQLYKDNGIRSGNVVHTTLDYLYHYAVRRMSKKARRRSLGPEDDNTVRRERRSKLSLKISSHKVYLRAGVKF